MLIKFIVIDVHKFPIFARDNKNLFFNDYISQCSITLIDPYCDIKSEFYIQDRLVDDTNQSVINYVKKYIEKEYSMRLEEFEEAIYLKIIIHYTVTKILSDEEAGRPIIDYMLTHSISRACWNVDIKNKF